jgi:hypothetical protein
MKLRILNYRVTATHEQISPLNSIAESVSISDFHAFIYDPTGGLMTAFVAVVHGSRMAEIAQNPVCSRV